MIILCGTSHSVANCLVIYRYSHIVLPLPPSLYFSQSPSFRLFKLSIAHISRIYCRNIARISSSVWDLLQSVCGYRGLLSLSLSLPPSPSLSLSLFTLRTHTSTTYLFISLFTWQPGDNFIALQIFQKKKKRNWKTSRNHTRNIFKNAFIKFDSFVSYKFLTAPSEMDECTNEYVIVSVSARMNTNTNTNGNC